LFNPEVVAPPEEPTAEPPAAETPPATDAPAGEVPADAEDAQAADAAPEAETPDPRVTTPLPETGLHTADGLPDGVQNLVSEASSGLVDDFDAMAGIGDDAGDAGGADGVLTAPTPPDAVDPVAADVLGESQVAAAVTQEPAPAMADVTATPTYDQPPPFDDLGLEMPDFAAEVEAMPEPEPITFDEPEFEPTIPDFAEPEPEPVAAADDGSDDLSVN
jgi:hypothetical protein